MAAKAAGKTGGKKSAPRTERAKKPAAITEAQAKAALSHLKGTGTTLLTESRKLGFSHNGPLRAALRELMGAKEYGKFMEERGRPRAGTEPKAAKKTPAKKTAAKKTSAPAKKPAARKRAARSADAPEADSSQAPQEVPAVPVAPDIPQATSPAAPEPAAAPPSSTEPTT